MHRRPTRSKTVTHLIQGARAAEAIVISIVLIGAAYTAAGLSDSFPRSVGWVLLAISGVALIVEINHWVKIVPGISGYAFLIALHSLSSGHIANHPEIPIPLPDAIATLAVFAAITLVSLTFVNRRLNRIDRIALLLFVAFFLWGYVAQTTSASIVRGSIALTCLVIAWAYDRSQRVGFRGRPVTPEQSDYRTDGGLVLHLSGNGVTQALAARVVL